MVARSKGAELIGFQILSTLVATLTFGAFVVAVRKHFVGESIPPGMQIVSILSFLAFVRLIASIWTRELSGVSASFGVLGQLIALGLFVSAIMATRAQRLTLAFSDDKPTFLARSGPYKWIRHPFYASYILFWWSGALVVQSIWCAITAFVLTGIYVIAAMNEERKFKRSDLAADYAAYRVTAGLMWPKFSVRP
jgi:protein-S-isoprenylcysteine O-methyltransferase Ste14